MKKFVDGSQFFLVRTFWSTINFFFGTFTPAVDLLKYE